MSVFRLDGLVPLGPSAVSGYRSGTAARLAGIPVATLRIWERRYEVVGPATRAQGYRRYSEEDIRRLTLIKALVDLGHPIGAIAHLPADALEAMRRDAARPGASPAPRRRARVALIGAWLASQGGERAGLLDIVAVCADRERAATALRGVSADVLAVDLPALREDAMASLEALAALVGATRVVVAHRFATQRAVAALRARGFIVVRAPIDLPELASLASSHVDAADLQPLARAPAPRFDDRTLATLAGAPGTMVCECPRNLAEILFALGAFERYSADCIRNSPGEADLHRYLERVAGTARVLFEEALARVAAAEGLTLPESC